jgi:hypothetical protein
MIKMVNNTAANVKAEMSATIKPFAPENAGITKTKVGQENNNTNVTETIARVNPRLLVFE